MIKRRVSTERSAFREHYESVHVPLALPLLEGLERYVRYHVESERFGEIGFDVLTAFWYRDKPATDRVFERVAGEEGEGIREDELRFMDKAANRFFAVSERIWQRGEEGEATLFALVTRPAGMSRFDCSSKLVRDHWPRLFKHFDETRFALLRDAFPMVGGDLPCDGIMQVGASKFAGVEGWSRSLEAEGYRVAVVETRRWETKVDAPVRSEIESEA